MSIDRKRCFSPWSPRLGLGVLLCAAACSPPLLARTALSDRINAEAHYRAAVGEAEKLQAEARKINAEAVAQEIQNWVDHVKAYYERRHLYEAEYRRTHPTEWEREEKRQAMINKRVTEQYQYIMNHGDHSMTEVLNWLLGEMSNSTTSLQYVFDAKSPLQPVADLKFSEDELTKINLSESRRAGSRLEFAAGDGTVLRPNWPTGLREHPCDAARDKFDLARDAVVKDLQANRRIGPESKTELLQAIDGLLVALEAAYPEEVRKKHREFTEYWKAKQFINDNLLAGAVRLIDVNDPSLLGGKLRFQGKTLFELLQYMHRNGLQFAAPAPGAEGLYQVMFENLRAMYIELAKEQPAPKAQGNGAAKD